MGPDVAAATAVQLTRQAGVLPHAFAPESFGRVRATTLRVRAEPAELVRWETLNRPCPSYWFGTVSVALVKDLRVDVGSRSLHVVAAGHGGPAVILEAGSGCSSEHWRAVQELAGESPATYSYDRAGHGLSDPAGPWTLEGWVADLEAWLAAARVPVPYLLVGHSLGCHVVRVFAARHPDEVAGLVLVDARCETLAPPETFLRRAAELMPYDAAQAWQQHQRDLAARFENSRLRIAGDSGHMIPVEEPELVVSEIRSMIKTVS
jgi:pimeloyl-ACP methyl ester carboxylesterase